MRRLLLLLLPVGLTPSTAEAPTPKGIGAQFGAPHPQPQAHAEAAGRSSGEGLHKWQISVNGEKREYLLYKPQNYHGPERMPLWILAPGSYNDPYKQLRMSDMVQAAEQEQFAFVALKGKDNLMNVVLHSQPEPGKADDVAYTRMVLEQVSKHLCIDRRRVFCTGYSRGARFCMRLASELAGVVAAVAPVSGIRYPFPNNATRPMPILAFHGTDDPINPFKGNGNPTYWHSSVPEAVKQWVAFNGCQRHETERVSFRVTKEKYTDCSAGADVILVKIRGGGHTWPGSDFHEEKDHWGPLGFRTRDIDAFDMTWAFFNRHPLNDTWMRESWGDSAVPKDDYCWEWGPSEGDSWDLVVSDVAELPLVVEGRRGLSLLAAACWAGAGCLVVATAAGIVLRRQLHRGSGAARTIGGEEAVAALGTVTAATEEAAELE